MYTNAVQRHAPTRDTDFTVQQPTRFHRVRRNILVLPAQYRVTGQHGVAVVAGIVDRIAPVGVVGPNGIGQKFVLRFIGPIRNALSVPAVVTLHFLQKHEVRPKPAQPIAQLVDNHAPVEVGKAFVNIVGRNVQGFGH